MSVSRFQITQFRNISDAKLQLHPSMNWVYGDNGSGKTSLLEALYTLGRLKSFRTQDVDQCLQTGREHLLLFAEHQSLRAHRVGVQRRDRRWDIHVDGEAVKDPQPVLQQLAVEIIEPNSHEIFHGQPKERRRFLDWGVFHVEPNYLAYLRDYRRALAQRNALLKQGWSASLDRVYIQQLQQSAEHLQASREAYLHDLQNSVSGLLPQLFPGLDVEISLRQGWAKDQALTEVLNDRCAKDRERGFTSVGPHKADVLFSSEGAPVAQRLSRGQQKALVYALKLAQFQLITDEGKTRILLVDDFASELDDERQHNVLDYLSQAGMQALVTATDRRFFPQQGFDAALFHVEQGVVDAQPL